jgi:hypothetical protein
VRGYLVVAGLQIAAKTNLKSLREPESYDPKLCLGAPAAHTLAASLQSSPCTRILSHKHTHTPTHTHTHTHAPSPQPRIPSSPGWCQRVGAHLPLQGPRGGAPRGRQLPRSHPGGWPRLAVACQPAARRAAASDCRIGCTSGWTPAHTITHHIHTITHHTHMRAHT